MTHDPYPLTRLRRLPERGDHDREVIDAILDAGMVAHVGFIRQGLPSVVPTLYVRHGDEVLIHGSPASALLRAAKAGADLCLTVTHLDGLVLARSAFNHSANYRSVMVYGRGRWVEKEDRPALLDAVIDRLIPGRSIHLREMSRTEVAGTAVVALPLTQSSAKVRTGPPVDEQQDLGQEVWAGVVPLRLTAGDPQPDHLTADGPLPPHVVALRTRFEGSLPW